MRLKLPRRFIEDCLDCECDIGTYENGYLTASKEQLAELVSRARHYAHPHGPDRGPLGLRRAAVALLVRITQETQP